MLNIFIFLSCVGLEPTTFRLEVGCAIQLRHIPMLPHG